MEIYEREDRRRERELRRSDRQLRSSMRRDDHFREGGPFGVRYDANLFEGSGSVGHGMYERQFRTLRERANS